MQFEFLFKPRIPGQPEEQTVRVSGRDLCVRLVKHRRARRYVLRLCPDGARVTIPRGGSAAEAKAFVTRQIPWLEKQLLRQATLPRGPKEWGGGSEILFRGEPARLDAQVEGNGLLVRFHTEEVRLRDASRNLRPAVERHLWKLARRELTLRVTQLAALHGFTVQRVTVRNQRSRWGSCSRRGTISLNWRLIQTPPFVSDYIILHELAHLKHMNHSQRFWREVARLCRDFQQAERWLRLNREVLR